MKILENNWLNLMYLLKNDFDTEDKLFLKKYMQKKEIYDKILAEKNNEKNTLSNKIRYDKLAYYFKNENTIPISFNEFCCPF